MASLQTAPIDNPLLFKRIRITNPGDIESLLPLIAAYAEHPSLADSVEEFAIDLDPQYLRWSTKSPTVPSRDIDDALYATMETRVRNLGLGSVEEEVLDVLDKRRREQHGSFVSVAAVVLLAMCKNISTLYLGAFLNRGTGRGKPDPFRGVVGQFLKSLKLGQLPQPCLQKLQRIEMIDGHREYESYGMSDFTTPLFYFGHLPEFRELVADGVAEYQNSPLPCEPRSASVTRIDICHTDIGTKTVAALLEIPQQLEEFTLSLGSLWYVDGGSPSTNLGIYAEKLALHKETLKKLDLDLRAAISENSWKEKEDDDRDTKATIGSLAEFQSLTHLSIYPQALLAPPKRGQSDHLINALPPSLKYLCLYGYEKGRIPVLDRCVEELMEKKGERLPLLEEVRGVDETVKDIVGLYGDEDDWYNDGYRRPRRSFDWIRL
ncbi:hypothetical protein FDECE_35 [Fusarium decemcellulare]|nr:hypothetical protein FDECE_35 [Fusarium decemcellulare]